MRRVLFLYSGEGTSHSETSYRLAQRSPRWTEIASAVRREREIDLEVLWEREIGGHQCPWNLLLGEGPAPEDLPLVGVAVVARLEGDVASTQLRRGRSCTI